MRVKNLGFHGLFDTDVLLSVVAAVAWAACVVQIPTDYAAPYHLAALGSCPGYRPKAGEISKTLLRHLSSLTANHLKPKKGERIYTFQNISNYPSEMSMPL